VFVFDVFSRGVCGLGCALDFGAELIFSPLTLDHYLLSFSLILLEDVSCGFGVARVCVRNAFVRVDFEGCVSRVLCVSMVV
jgi:hypothetical protein